MNWKDYPNLFANGKFSYRCYPLVKESKPFTEWNYAMKKFIREDAYDFKLIARPISDMNDEELIDYENLCEPDIHFKYNRFHTLFMPHPKSFMYLLSIGVYPLSDTTDVIFKEKE